MVRGHFIAIEGIDGSRFGAFEDAEILKAVRAIYLELCEEGKMVKISADRELAEVRADIVRIISERLGVSVDA